MTSKPNGWIFVITEGDGGQRWKASNNINTICSLKRIHRGEDRIWIFVFEMMIRTVRFESSFRGEKHWGARVQVWAVRKAGITTLQAAKLRYSANNGPIYQTKHLRHQLVEEGVNWLVHRIACLTTSTIKKKIMKNHHWNLVMVNHDSLPSSTTAEIHDSLKFCRQTDGVWVNISPCCSIQ